MVAGLSLGVSAGLLASACAEEEPQDFTVDTRTGFLAACTQPLEDSRLISAICQCVFDETQGQLSFERFQAIDAELVAQAEAAEEAETTPQFAPRLPDDLADIIADCVVAETEL